MAKETRVSSSTDQLRYPAEVRYREEIDALAENDKDERPENWRLSPRAVSYTHLTLPTSDLV